jgi:hypothetical protein
MGKNIKLIFKWTFVFGILIFWSSFIVLGTIGGGFAKDFNIPIYIQTLAGIERASSSDILEILFNNDFEINEEMDYIPIEKCSVRATGGSLDINEQDFGEKNKISFYIPNGNAEKGTGSLSGRINRDRFSLKFNVNEILETNSEILRFSAEGQGRLNRQKIDFGNIIVELNKTSNKVSISSSEEYKDLQALNVEVTSLKGCLMEEKIIYLIIDQGELDEKRSIGEVRSLLDDHPELIDAYFNLEKLYKDYWWLAFPGGGIVSG